MAEPIVFASLGPQGGGYELAVYPQEFADYSQDPPRRYTEFVLDTRWDDLEDVSAQVGGTHADVDPIGSNAKSVFYTSPESQGLHLYHIGLAMQEQAPS